MGTSPGYYKRTSGRRLHCQLGLRRFSSTIFSGLPITQSSGNPHDFFKDQRRRRPLVITWRRPHQTSAFYEIKAVVLPPLLSSVKGLKHLFMVSPKLLWRGQSGPNSENL